jgi:hypothetical protein
MQAPAAVLPGQTFKLPVPPFNSFAVDDQGFVTVSAGVDQMVLGLVGFVKVEGRNNLSATTDPTTMDDSTVDYLPGSQWINGSATNDSGSAPRAWLCVSSAPSAAVWIQTSVGSDVAGSAEFGNLTIDGLINGSCTQVTAFSGGGQSGATQLTTLINNITTATSSSSPYDSYKLPATGTGGGRWVWVLNSAANPAQAFGLSAATINAFGSTIGFTHPPGSLVLFVARDTDKWSAFNFDKGFTVPYVYNTNSATAGTTLTGADISGAINEVALAMTGTMSGDANWQLPTVANLVAAIPNPVAGWAYKLAIVNKSSANHTGTITTNTGWDVQGTMTIAQGATRSFHVKLTTLSAAVLQSIDA